MQKSQNKVVVFENFRLKFKIWIFTLAIIKILQFHMFAPNEFVFYAKKKVKKMVEK